MSAGSEVTWELRMVHCATVQGFTARRRRGYRIHWLSRFPGITKKCWRMFLQSAAAAEGASRGYSSPENLLPQNRLKRHIFFFAYCLCVPLVLHSNLHGTGLFSGVTMMVPHSCIQLVSHSVSASLQPPTLNCPQLSYTRLLITKNQTLL